MSENCGAIVIFLIYGQFGAIRNLDSGRIVCNAYIFTNSNKPGIRTKKSLIQLTDYCFE